MSQVEEYIKSVPDEVMAFIGEEGWITALVLMTAGWFMILAIFSNNMQTRLLFLTASLTCFAMAIAVHPMGFFVITSVGGIVFSFIIPMILGMIKAQVTRT